MLSERAKRASRNSLVRREMKKVFLASKEVYDYYKFYGRYEFCLAPLNYYERQKIKIKLRKTGNLYLAANYRFIEIHGQIVTKYLTELYHDNKNLTNISSSICNLKTLIHLNLFNNKLTKIPSFICNFKLLTVMFLGNNQLTSLPSTIGNLKSLAMLSLINNKLTNLPSSMSDLKSLEYLDLSFNHLTELPSMISNFKSLKYIYLNNNQLKNDYIIYVNNLLPKCIVA